MNNNNFIGIDIFSGAGGLSIGAIKAGINISVALEMEMNAARTFKRNHPKTNVIIEDIRKVNIENLQIKSPFIIFGGPPCQGFSVSNRQTRRLDNENNNLFEEFIRFVKTLSPKWFLFENVEGIVSFNNGTTVKKLCSIFQEIGYSVTWKVLNASDYGVPQDRNRFIMVGNNIGIDFNFPLGCEKKITVADAINDLPNLMNGDMLDSVPYKKDPTPYAKELRNGSEFAIQNYVSRNKDYVLERYKYIKPGQNWQAIPEHLMGNYKDKSRCHSGIYKRLNPDKPSVVISNYRKNMLIHPQEDRGLSVREAARIQSFPDNFFFEGTLMHIQQQIGNAVPPKLAEVIFKQIIDISKKNG